MLARERARKLCEGIPVSDGSCTQKCFMMIDQSAHTPAERSVFEANLRVLERTCPATAATVRTTSARTDLVWHQSDDGAWSAQVDGRWLSSRRAPLEEAARFAAALDPQEAGAAVITGFGTGHHVRTVCERMGKAGVVVCYEPDVALLRAVLERVECAHWMERGNLAILCQTDDAALISSTLRGVEGVVALGIKILHHQPSQPRLGAGAGQFCEVFTGVVRALRTTVVTTLMQTETTLRNLLVNADWYASAPGVGELVGCAAGRPAVVVSAGPSLRRNMALLAEPGVRERVVIIAVQTVLKPLLEAGIKPHYVVAVDYHEISRRFYEGLTAADVRGVTLICDPKANPVIAESFPGAVRMPHDGVLSALLETAAEHDSASVPPSATVAHLAYSTARLLGCDPVILIGQDLGFSDGQYYGPRAAVHDVWACELNQFRTLEMLEWERIVRGRRHSRLLEDVHGRPIYTDEQMHSYLVQFERMFADDVAKGLRVVDATEGGVAKRHTVTKTLRQALVEAIDETEASAGPWSPPAAVRDDAARTLAASRVRTQYERLIGQVTEIASIGRKSAELLDRMIAAAGNQQKIDPLIREVHTLGKQVTGLEPGYGLVQYLNQTGTLKRFKADRALHYDEGLPALERQVRQIERDKENVSWLADAADQLNDLLALCAEALRTGIKPTDDPRDKSEQAGPRVQVQEQVRGGFAAVIAVDPYSNTLGRPRDLSRPYAGGENPLRRTLARLAASRSIDRVILLSEHAERVRTIVGGPIAGLEVIIEQTPSHPLGAKRTMVATARRYASTSWRGGLGGATVYDEIISAPLLLDAMRRHQLAACVVAGDDWVAVDPGLTDACIERHLDYPQRHRLVFTQAAPGLAPVVLERSLVEELAGYEGKERLWTSLAGLLGYLPAAPMPDPIAKASCVRVEAVVRDAPIRCIADGSWHSDTLAEMMFNSNRSAHAIASGLAEARWAKRTRPLEVTMELCTGRLIGGLGAMARLGRSDPPERRPLSTAIGVRIVRELAKASPDATLTLHGAGDPLLHSAWRAIAQEASGAGLSVHVRTDLLCDSAVDMLMDSGADVVSVDLYANDARTYATRAGVAHFDRVQSALAELIARRDAERPEMWIVPRMTRCDAVLDQIEAFYDHWLLAAGACVIDRPVTTLGERRVEPLPLPRLATLRKAAWSLRVRCDGVAYRPTLGGDVDLTKTGLMEAWVELRRKRAVARPAA
jgi:hypothetical protein